jgi:hypothetical protein
VPGGERQCDLYALARTPLIVDAPPGYLRLPRALRSKRKLSNEQAAFLCDCARRAIACREAGERRYLVRFEREIAEAWRAGLLEDAPARPVRTAVDTLRLGLDFVRARLRAVSESMS